MSIPHEKNGTAYYLMDNISGYLFAIYLVYMGF